MKSCRNLRYFLGSAGLSQISPFHKHNFVLANLEVLLVDIYVGCGMFFQNVRAQIVLPYAVGIGRAKWALERYIGTWRLLREFSRALESDCIQIRAAGIGDIDLVILVAFYQTNDTAEACVET